MKYCYYFVLTVIKFLKVFQLYFIWTKLLICYSILANKYVEILQ